MRGRNLEIPDAVKTLWRGKIAGINVVIMVDKYQWRIVVGNREEYFASLQHAMDLIVKEIVRLRMRDKEEYKELKDLIRDLKSETEAISREVKRVFEGL